MSAEKDFVAELMNKFFNFKAPPMPDFSQIKEDQKIVELNFEQLEYLNAAGKLELLAEQSLRNVVKNNKNKN